jgi:signal transduction histidine kinase
VGVRSAARRRWARIPQRARDIGVATFVAALDLLVWSDLLLSSTVNQDRSSNAAMLLAGLANLALLVPRRRFPAGVLAAVCAVSATTALLLTYRPIFPVCVALGTLASRRTGGPVTAGVALALATTGAWVADEVRVSPEVDRVSVAVVVGVSYALVVLVAAAIGRWARSARERLRLMDERRQLEAALAVEAERLRLARELHDIVSHAVTVMVLQASGARRVIAHDLDRAAAALATVEEVGGQAMNELRRLLGVLRTGEGDGAGTAALPGVDDLAPLVDGVRRAGVEVSLDTSGARRRLDSSVGLAAYRVVQEALTNVTKHAGPGARAAVTLAWTADTLVVTVVDDGSAGGGEPALSTGHGLLGLRERVSVAGGTLVAGPTPGGYTVTAVLPLADPASCPAAPEASGLSHR